LIALPEFGAAVDFASIAEGVAEGEAWIKRTEKFERISAGIAKAEIGRVRMVGAVMLDEGSMQGELDELLKSPTPRFIRNVPMSGSGESRGLELSAVVVRDQLRLLLRSSRLLGIIQKATGTIRPIILPGVK